MRGGGGYAAPVRRGVSLLALSCAVLIFPAGAQAGCGAEVLNDLVAHDGEVVASYHAQACYRDALQNLGDIGIYSSFEQRIESAMRRDADGRPRTLAGVDGGLLSSSGPERANEVPMPVVIGAGVALLLVVSGGVAALVRRRTPL